MRLESSVVCEDCERINTSGFIPWERLRGKTVLITGATGLIGSSLISALLYANERRNLGMRLLALVRNKEKAENIFGKQLRAGIGLKLIQGDVQYPLPAGERVEYIVHGACPTASAFFVRHPAQTLQSLVQGAINILDLAQAQHVEGVVFLSSMEVYGYPERGRRVNEADIGAFHPASIRNCYPIGKLACESLFCAYAREYGVPAKVLRLTQTFGPGVRLDDGRVFAEFARCALEKTNIVLKTRGETERSYLYTADAAAAILTVLLKGAAGQIYTAANEETYCSVYEMAELVAGMAQVQVCIEEQDTSMLGYAKTLYMDLDVSKLKELGWSAKVGLEDMYRRMISEMKRTLKCREAERQ